jgi:hypothetical protein
VTHLRTPLPPDATDDAVLLFADESGCVRPACDRHDFLELAAKLPHRGVVIVIRRRTRAAERAALFRLLESAAETGIRNSINLA